MEWDIDAMRCLESFRVIRDSLSAELNLPVNQAYVLQGNVLRQPFPSHEIIIAEVCSVNGGFLQLSVMYVALGIR